MVTDGTRYTSGRRLGTSRATRIAWTALTVGATVVAASAAEATATPAPLSVIVMERPGAGNAPERAVARLGGKVERQLPIVRGFSAKIPASAMVKLRTARGVLRVTPNRTLRANGYLPGSNYDNEATMTSLYNAVRVVGGEQYWLRGITGAGIDVALIDTGVTRVPGLDAPGKVIDGPDLSFESQDPALTHKDNYGHGTHLAGIIAGNDRPGSTGAEYAADSSAFIGIAPDARIVNMKVGDGDGVTDVSQVIAAIDWVVQHRNTDGLNIRVMEIAFGSDSTQPYDVDPLAFATEVAMDKGIVVVNAAGNGGKQTPGPGLTSPAYHPRSIAVGASDSRGTNVAEDDTVAGFSSSAKDFGGRGPDVLAPGISIPSLMAPGSSIANGFGPYASVGTRFIKGSGTSQASALVAGGVALLVQQRPSISHDRAKATITYFSKRVLNEPTETQGRGVVQFDWIIGRSTRTAPIFTRTFGTGSLDATRGTRRVEMDGVAIQGEIDIMGEPFAATAWAPAADAGTTWTAEGDWNGRTWSGRTWNGSSWSGVAWSGRTWSGRTWSGRTWSGAGWSGDTWSGRTWSTAAWF